MLLIQVFRLPKTDFVSLTQLKFGINFNIGRKSSYIIYEKLNIITGRYITKGCDNQNRLFMAE